MSREDLAKLRAGLERLEALDAFAAALPRAIDLARQEEREAERAAMVAWLRDVAETMAHNGERCCGRVEDLADAIERGEHRREEEK